MLLHGGHSRKGMVRPGGQSRAGVGLMERDGDHGGGGGHSKGIRGEPEGSQKGFRVPRALWWVTAGNYRCYSGSQGDYCGSQEGITGL